MIPYGTNLHLKHFTWTTTGLLAANWIVFLFHHAMDYEIAFWIMRNFFTTPGELAPWSLVTSMFLHADIWHIGFNSLYLWVFGTFVEDKLGWKAYLFLYFLTGIAASLVHGSMTGLFMREKLFIPSLGASGAISGIMGVYLYRCYYSKIKLLIIFWFPIRIRIPAVIILTFWFLQDFLGGIDSIRGIYQNVAFWAHVGGFASGFGACKYLHYEIQARKEKLEFVAETALAQYGGYEEGIRATEKLMETDPENPEWHLHLARVRSRWRASREGKDHYEKAIRLLLKRDPEKAGEVFCEYWGKYLSLLEPASQVRLSLLFQKKNPDLSAITLQSLINSNQPLDIHMKEAYLLLGRIYHQELKRKDLARNVYEKFLKDFPDSKERSFVQKTLGILLENT